MFTQLRIFMVFPNTIEKSLSKSFVAFFCRIQITANALFARNFLPVLELVYVHQTRISCGQTSHHCPPEKIIRAQIFDKRVCPCRVIICHVLVVSLGMVMRDHRNSTACCILRHQHHIKLILSEQVEIHARIF